MKNRAKQRIVIEALLQGKDLGEAAEAAGVHRNTVTAWFKDADFQAELKAAEEQAHNAFARSLTALAETAVETLEDVLTVGKSDGAKVRAADIVLERLIQYRELTLLEGRIAALEQVMKDE